MDSSTNGSNKAIVLIAVAIIGVAAGQYLTQKGNAPQPTGPWVQGYQYPPNYPHPQPGYGQGYVQPVPYGGVAERHEQARMAPGDIPSGIPRTIPSRSRRSMTRLVSSSDLDEAVDENDQVPQPVDPSDKQAIQVAARPSEAATAVQITQAAVGAFLYDASEPAVEIAFIEDRGILWPDEAVRLSSDTARLYLRANAPAAGREVVITNPAGDVRVTEKSILDAPIIGNIYGPVPIKVHNTISNSDSATFSVLLQNKTTERYGGTSSAKIVRLSKGTVTPAGVMIQTSRIGEPKLPGTGTNQIQDQFVRVTGTAAAGSVEVVVCSPSDIVKDMYTPVNQLPFRTVPQPGTNQWAITPSLGALPIGSNGKLVIRGIDGDLRHVYAASDIAIVLQPLASIGVGDLAVSSVQQLDNGGNPESGRTGPRFNRKKLKIDGKVPLSSSVQDGYAVVLVNGVEVASTRKPLGSDTTYTSGWEASNDGKYSISIGIVQGGATLARAESQEIEIRQTGPRPTHISPDNLAMTPGLNTVDIHFSPDNPIDRSSVDEAKLKAIVTINPSLVPTSAELIDGRRIQLKFSEVPPNLYKITIAQTENVKDRFGNLIGASPNSAENKASFEFQLLKPICAELSAVQTAGLRNMTGPNVPYQEYTEPRKSQVGFNPSDKVVTRVARLYYFRDAHRVIQIIKRDAARSYNRQAVDMQQQLADNARRDAENATIDRKTSETAAIQAAQRARTAETALTQFQQALVQARQQKSQADSAVAAQQKVRTNAENELTDATQTQRDLEGQLAGLKPDDPNVTKLNDQIKVAKSQVLTKSRNVQAEDQKLTQSQLSQTEAAAQVAERERNVNAILSEVQNARDAEARHRNETEVKQLDEERKHKELFRREVAAAKEDPDTYAPGKPDSQDPIEQVSMSVIGEGVIQMRGPLKGVNLARTLINQIDAPVGQVRVAIHTVQVNGEHGKRMEPVIGRIQRYIDHSRFLTTQSAQMLRNAVTLVASRRADQALVGCDALSQFERDEKYIESFFGREFLAELRTLDSEFLHTGNKLLSIHSMDSTSLSNALFLLSLAKNDVRQEILCEFERMVLCQLPQDEQDYFTASTEKYKFGPPLHKTKFEFLGHNAKFVSLKGFFNAEVAGPDTMTPMQREFIRLAQIFKSRLVTEIQLEQRLMERSLIEQRINGGAQEEMNAIERESMAKKELEQATRERLNQQQRLENVTSKFIGLLESQQQLIEDINLTNSELTATAKAATEKPFNSTDEHIGSYSQQIELYKTLIDRKLSETKDANTHAECVDKLKKAQGIYEFFNSRGPAANEAVCETVAKDLWNIRESAYELLNEPRQKKQWKLLTPPSLPFPFKTRYGAFVLEVTGRNDAKITGGEEKVAWKYLEHLVLSGRHALAFIENFQLSQAATDKVKQAKVEIDRAEKCLADRDLGGYATAYGSMKSVLATSENISSMILIDMRAVENEFISMRQQIQGSDADFSAIFGRWRTARNRLFDALSTSGSFYESVSPLFRDAETGFTSLLSAETALRIASQTAGLSRRPLDHKKFLDMLIDDVEEKFIELMEGTRAHTANIDNYLSRLGQALEDDFNTQFYFPAFRGIREASRFWDVNLGAVETTSVLTNNRTFAKVSPQATMEFDLPKRDILINEAFKSAKAAYDDYGALMNDPSFLALTKMHRGQPASATYGKGGGNPTTRNVLPGLPSSTDEKLVAQNQAVSPDFPSALESLIPDPAIYKFETGTGFEVRPVIQPDGQAVVFHLNYMYTTNVREPVRADEKHLGRVKRHFIDTDVQTGNYELREVSRYQVALKASRTSRGVPFLEDLPGVGIAFRPMPNQESSIQENLILAQTVIFPTLFDLMGLRWAPAVADLDALRLHEADFVTRGRQRALRERVFDYSSSQVDEFIRIPEAERRPDLYRSQETIPSVHPNGYSGPGLNQHDAILRERHSPQDVRPESRFVPGTDSEGSNGRGSIYRQDLNYQYSPPPTGESRLIPPRLSPPRGSNVPPQPLSPHERTAQQKSPVPGAAPASGIELQTYKVEEPIPPANRGLKGGQVPGTPKASAPVRKSGAAPALLPPMSRSSEKTLEPFGIDSGLSSPLPAPPPTKLVSNPKGSPSRFVPAPAKENVRPAVIDEPSKSPKKFSLWQKK